MCVVTISTHDRIDSNYSEYNLNLEIEIFC